MTILRFLTLTRYFEHYSKISHRPQYSHILLLIHSLVWRRFQNFQSLLRFIRANQLQGGSLAFQDSEFPGIEGLIVCAPKDFPLLSMCVDSLVENSMNPVLKVSIIVPDASINLCEEQVSSARNRDLVKIVPESGLLNTSSLSLLKSKFPQGHGWVLQQFLTISFCSQSEQAGVLAINADTMLLRKQAWLSDLGNQVLMVSSEFHEPYYELLSKMNPRLRDRSRTFITHHMLFQPRLLNQFLSDLGYHNASELLERTLELTDYSVVSPICMEFEFYAQHMMLLHPGRVQLRKFANVGVSRGTGLSPEAILENFKTMALYNSISMHSWMD